MEKTYGKSIIWKKFWIIGYGNIGKYLSKLIKTFGANVIISDIKKFRNINQKPLSFLISNSDIISINANYNSKVILDKKRINQLKKNCILINNFKGPNLSTMIIFIKF